MNLLREIFCGEENFSRRIVRLHAALILVSVAFVYVFSYSTSPRYTTWGDDSAIFQLIGKCWAQGLLPYVDLFENKGPLLFFIDALGYTITPRVGVMLFQIPAMYFAMLLAWRTLELFTAGTGKFAAAVFMLIYYAAYYLDGNRTEEWSMPFLMAATYFFLRTLKNSADEKFLCPPTVGAVYGVGFGACILLRASNAAPICCYVLLTAIFLLQAREFKILRQNFLSFVAGAVIICLPFVIYFAAHGALYDALYGTILLNVLYTTGTEHYPLNRDYFFYVTINFLPLLMLIAVSLTGLLRERNRLLWSGLFVGAAMLLFMMRLRPYIGYCPLIVPTMPLLFAGAAAVSEMYSAPLKRLWHAHGFSFGRLAIKFFSVCVIAVLCLPLWVYVNKPYSTVVAAPSNNEISTAMIKFSDIIPQNERQSLVTWGRGGFIAELTLTTGLQSREKFFGYIKAFGETDPSIRATWFEHVEENPPLWILYCWLKVETDSTRKDSILVKYLGNKDAELERLLAERYTLRGEALIYGQVMKLYRLKSAQ
ncbi:MAG: hypothetical protein SR1Q7_10850 [Quinella sp. 1Q7]|nr:hypothetical protein [Quinella sp. 1Q7]